MVKVFKALNKENRFNRLIIKSAADYTPLPTDSDYLPKNDVPWIAARS
jgi:hypothetical protein